MGLVNNQTNMNSTTDNFNPSKSYYQKDKLDLDSWFHVTQIDYEKLIENVKL